MLYVGVIIVRDNWFKCFNVYYFFIIIQSILEPWKLNEN